MRREGKQHHGSKVRIIACKLPPGNGPRAAAAAADAKANGRASTVSFQTQESPPPLAGSYAKSPAKPTDHSKHPGKCKKSKCRECHHAAATASKSRDKGKGALKLRSSDVLLNHRLTSWRVVDTAGASVHPGFNGASASELLRQLSASRHSHDSDDQKADERCMELLSGYGADIGGSSAAEPPEFGYDDDSNAEENVDYGYGQYYGGSDNMVVECAEAKQEEVIGPSSADDGEDEDADDDADNDVDTDMDYFVVGMAWEYSDGEDWLVVQEM